MQSDDKTQCYGGKPGMVLFSSFVYFRQFHDKLHWFYYFLPFFLCCQETGPLGAAPVLTTFFSVLEGMWMI